MSRTKHYALCFLFMATLLIVCRLLDYRYQSQCEEFPIESCVTVDLVHGEIAYQITPRCLLVVKAFKAGRQSAKALMPNEQSLGVGK
jgi:hypothetical protein